MANNELNVRIALKYDSYSAWTTGPGKDVVLLAGEIGICEIPSNDSTTAPIALFKVGDGEKTFEKLPWASAKAYDVHDWAKASEVKLVDKKLVFVGGKADGADLEIAFDYVTSSDLNTIFSAIRAINADLEALKEANPTTESIAGIKERLDIIEGEENGSIKKAVSETLGAAKAYTDTKVTSLGSALAQHGAAIEENKSNITQETVARQAAILELNKLIGGSYSETATIHEAITAINNTSTQAQQIATQLGAQVSRNTAAITDITDQVDALEVTDQAIANRLTKVEAFFNQAKDHDGYTGLDKALDTLIEIQDYLTGEGEGTSSVIGRVTANETAIKSIQDLVKSGGTFDKRINAIASGLEVTSSSVSTLESIINSTAETASKASSAAAAAEAKAVQAQTDINNLAVIVGNEDTGLVKQVTVITNSTSKMAAEVTSLGERTTAAEDAILTLQNIVSAEGDTSNAKLREAITELQDIVKTGENANEALRSDIQNLQAILNNADTGLAKALTIANRAVQQAQVNASSIEAIRDDYLKEADEFILSCGTSTKTVQTDKII